HLVYDRLEARFGPEWQGNDDRVELQLRASSHEIIDRSAEQIGCGALRLSRPPIVEYADDPNVFRARSQLRDQIGGGSTGANHRYFANKMALPLPNLDHRSQHAPP